MLKNQELFLVIDCLIFLSLSVFFSSKAIPAAHKKDRYDHLLKLVGNISVQLRNFRFLSGIQRFDRHTMAKPYQDFWQVMDQPMVWGVLRGY